MRQITILPGPERRRRWGEAERTRILEAAFAPGASVSAVSRCVDVATSLIHKWRAEAAVEKTEPSILPAVVTEDAVIAVPPACGPGYMLRRWAAFTRFLDDGRICLSNNAAARALRGIALGRKSWLFCGSDRGGERAAAIYRLIVTEKMNEVDPQGWLADVLARIAAHPAHRLDELLPWHWSPLQRLGRATQAARP